MRQLDQALLELKRQNAETIYEKIDERMEVTGKVHVPILTLGKIADSFRDVRRDVRETLSMYLVRMMEFEDDNALCHADRSAIGSLHPNPTIGDALPRDVFFSGSSELAHSLATQTERIAAERLVSLQHPTPAELEDENMIRIQTVVNTALRLYEANKDPESLREALHEEEDPESSLRDDIDELMIVSSFKLRAVVLTSAGSAKMLVNDALIYFRMQPIFRRIMPRLEIALLRMAEMELLRLLLNAR